MNKLNLILVFVAIGLAIIAGSITGTDKSIFGVTYYELYDLVGQLFLNALKLVIVPLVASSIIIGIARMGEEKAVFSLGLKTFGTFFALTLLAVICGYLVVVWMDPGSKQSLALTKTYQEIDQSTLFSKLKDILLRILPQNIIQAAAEGQMLGLIFFCFLFGYFTSKIDPHLSGTLQSFFKGVFQVMMLITHFVIQFLPLGVFALVAKVVASSGMEAIRSSGWFFVTALTAFALYGIVALSVILKFQGRVSPWGHMKAMAPAILTAFTTSSSAATFPVTLESLEKRGGVSNRIASFVLPLGTSVHMAGTAIFECVATFYLAQAYGIELNLASQILVILLSFIMSIGIAGIPSASLVVVVVILNMVGIPVEGIALLLVVERLLDMFRTVMNVYSNSVSTVLVARSEGEKLTI